ncbi:hypothetical protein PILCRDRAFT_245791 [Piloderma croceum F 1598]|uniref:Uncharacterized protein n=1 Tax=Piloderma croceum (strain F 1598) TaxID=765440 RepID=A0A0C3CGR1_PILCF|nr:hypothetical protein PILCRDRAFT_245791 [Piloderma croceum F 1598]
MASDDEDIEFVNRSKTRFRRRLHDRWTCDVPGHTYCYANQHGAHLPLSHDMIENWVTDLHNGETSLLTPPAFVLPAVVQISSPSSDIVSITSTSSSNTIEYQRRFRMQLNPSLTDIRSMRNRLHKLVSSPSTSGISSSTTSSGTPGIGYLSGKAVKWVGLKILNSLGTLEICRRRWLIRRLVNQAGRIPEDRLVTWLMTRSRAVTRTIEDLLELSSCVACIYAPCNSLTTLGSVP